MSRVVFAKLHRNRRWAVSFTPKKSVPVSAPQLLRCAVVCLLTDVPTNWLHETAFLKLLVAQTVKFPRSVEFLTSEYPLNRQRQLKSAVPLSKLAVVQLVNKLHFIQTPRFITVFAGPDESNPCFFIEVHCNVTVATRSLSWG